MKDETELAMRGGGVEKNEPVGHFPRDVWLVDDHFAAENAPPAPHLYRFEESDWRVLEPLRSKPADGHWFQVSPWTPGHALVLHTRSKNDELLVELRAYGSGAHPPVPRRTQRAGVPVLTTPSEVRGFADGALFLVGMGARGQTVIEIWPNPSPPSRVVELTPDINCSPLSIHAPDPADIVIVGSKSGSATTPCAVAIRDGVPRAVDIPKPVLRPRPWSTEATSYAREPAGIEWLVLTAGHFTCGYQCQAGHRGALFRRAPGRSWERVKLPFARLSNRPNVELQPLEVRVIDTGDVWVEAHYVEAGQMQRGAILRTKQPVEVCRIEEPDRRCRPEAPLP